MYLEAIFRFYIFFYHFIGHSLFRLVRLGSFSDIIKRHFALTLAKLHFYADCAVRFFVGKQYYRLHMTRYVHFYVFSFAATTQQYDGMSILRCNGFGIIKRWSKIKRLSSPVFSSINK